MSTSHDRPGTVPWRFIALLALVSATGPFAMQIFLPALPSIARDFAVDPGVAQLTLSAAMAAIAVSTLAYGPLSDRFGRRPVLLAGLALFLIGSVACVLARTVEALVVARIVQAAGGAAGMVLARAMARDLHDATGAAIVISRLTMVMVLAPMVAPVIGGVFHDAFGWRSIFVLVAALAVLVFVLGWLRVEESREPVRVGGGGLLRGFVELLGTKRFVVLMLYPAFSSMIFFGFISGAPYVMAEILHRPATEYGLWFMLVAGSYILGNFGATRLTRRFGSLNLMVAGMVIAVAGALLLILAQGLGGLTPATLFLPVALTQIGQGLGLPNAQAAALDAFPARAGTASALTGFTQMLAAGAASQAVGQLQDDSAWPLIILLTIAAIAALTVSLVARTMARG
jgi:DHA1 family bicyclomycin/chloramphenicol resistance-like MFS transporter